ncbi:MAG: hypothetical protein COX44_01235 [Candidatus Portnoybacteria bacterium CG23_combo_of_CG06-09_8_20_14_all_37_13]|uniref:Uncharacterized protein n=1 Tax=Candidatus Portnoybacteria bacterium CG23_combo_of_CG06-09_8_20_14_all_37_13 TaxID=1974819 RepID=A0A2G9YD81_9BACT|nr:MAG: hypothetical protein COX44_01235 [Candidatus Portnoybacteria bacterium CG23_combo_of_CG06-09_8_20_14_all_37_13]
MFKQLFVIIIIALVMYIALDSWAGSMFKPLADASADVSAKLDVQKQQADKIIIISVIGIFCFFVLIASRVWIKNV